MAARGVVAEAANVPAQGMKSLGVHMCVEGMTSDVLVAAWDRAKNLKKATPLGKPKIDGSLDRKGSVDVYDLPVKPWSARGNASIKSVVDIVTDVDAAEMAAVDWAKVKDIMAEGKYKELPPPFCFSDPEAEPPCTMNLAVTQRVADGLPIVVKWIQFIGGEKSPFVRDSIIRGNMHVLDWRKDVFNSARTMQILFERLGGVQARYWEFVSAPAPRAGGGDVDVDQKKKELSAGIQHIKDEAPRTNADCEQLEWVECELVDPSSPIHNLRRELINAVLKVLRDRDHFANKLVYYPILLPDVRDEYQGAMRRAMEMLDTNTVLCVGEAGFGKTPFMMSMAMASARHNADAENRATGRADAVAAVRTAPDMDFFRGEVGQRWVPCIFDDGDLAEQRPKVLKAFFDTTQAEAMTYVRWGAAKFVRGQARFGGDNEYDASAAPTATQRALASTGADAAQKTTAILTDMLKPTFPKNFSPSNVGAMLKRCTVFLNTPTDMFFRLAGTESRVEKLPLMDGYLKPEAGKMLRSYLARGVMRDEEEFDRVMAYEKKMVMEIMAKRGVEYGVPAEAAGPVGEPAAGAAAPPPPSSEEEDPFGLGGSMIGEQAEAPAAAPVVPTAPIKREPSNVFSRNLRQNGPVEIDLCSPSPLKKKVKFESGTVPLQKVKLEPGSSDAVGQDEFGQKPPKPRKLSLVLGDIMAHELNGAAGLSPDSDVATEQGAVSLTQALEEHSAYLTTNWSSEMAANGDARRECQRLQVQFEAGVDSLAYHREWCSLKYQAFQELLPLWQARSLLHDDVRARVASFLVPTEPSWTWVPRAALVRADNDPVLPYVCCLASMELLHWMRPAALAVGFPADAVPASQEGARLRVKWRLMEMQMYCIYDELEDVRAKMATLDKTIEGLSRMRPRGIRRACPFLARVVGQSRAMAPGRVFPAPKRGKARAVLKTGKPKRKAPKHAGKTTAKKTAPNQSARKVPYVRHGKRTCTSRPERVAFKRNVFDFTRASDREIVDMLLEDQVLENLEGQTCSFCTKGTLGPLKDVQGRGPRYRCNHKGCQKFSLPQSGHMVFSSGSGVAAVPLQEQSAVLFAVVNNVPLAKIHALTGKNHKAIESMSKFNDACRKSDVQQQEKLISFGGKGRTWKDVEADEVDLRGDLLPDHAERAENERVQWEQWGGVIERGNRKTLVLTRLKPSLTKQRAPGPGAIRLPDWTPFAHKNLSNRNVVLHTDGAKTYKVKVEGMLHDHVVHQRKRLVKNGKPVKKNGRQVWVKPTYAKKFQHKLPGGRVLKCKGGTQIIDRFWQHLRGFIKTRKSSVGSVSLNARVRSAQWAYWHANEDLWLETGKMFSRLRGK
ncbi:unnamed protein product [Prorocentrum cordatum]|uniref:RNA helicase n=1 Tax=Prorocentrum cordatum TaxID=2364126 RepID=A0ABN9SH58_9DINO|nr:unnamed protein product [Polarella glacialis]